MSTSISATRLGSQYNREYYRTHCGPPYDRSNPHWAKFFGNIAEWIVREFRPTRALDVGCAKGFLVEALRDRGVEAWGFDISEYAISEVRADMRPFCRVASLDGAIQEEYDLITCIEVLEHVSEEEGRTAIQDMTKHSRVIVFSSTPDDCDEPTHVTVRPILHWLRIFADCGFEVDHNRDVSVISPQAFVVQRCARPSNDVVFASALAITRKLELLRLNDRRLELEASLRSKDANIAEMQRKVDVAEEALRNTSESLIQTEETLKAVLNSRGWRVLNHYRDLRNLLRSNFTTFVRPKHRITYQSWIKARERRIPPQKAQVEIAQFRSRPIISVVMPVHNTPQEYLEKAIASVRSQYYPYWELCICDDGSTEVHVGRLLEEAAQSDDRIKVVFSPNSGGIVAASNKALELATGEFVAFLDHDDEFTPDALYEVVRFLQEHETADFIYSDEDKLEPNGERSDPFFKPDWSPELMLSCMYTCHLSIYRKQLVDSIGGFRRGFDGSQDYDLALRATERTTNIFHLPKILYHWRKAPSSVASARGAKPYAYEAAKRALAEHTARRGYVAEVLDGQWRGHYRVRFALRDHQLVSIIIPTRDRVELLRKCIAAIERRSTYRNYEIVIVDNDSATAETRDYLHSIKHRVLRAEGPFNFSKLNNYGVQQSAGKYLLFLNNDTEVISPDWIESMLEFCQQPDIGVVGAKLLYPNKTIQHAGVVLGLGSVQVAGHVLLGQPPETRHCFGMSCNIRNYSAVTAACMMVGRETFERVGGFDERLAAAYNDVDICLRVRKLGLRIVWTPFAQLYHCESASRGQGINSGEVRFMQQRWGQLLVNDPYYNPNLSLRRTDFELDLG